LIAKIVSIPLGSLKLECSLFGNDVDVSLRSDVWAVYFDLLGILLSAQVDRSFLTDSFRRLFNLLMQAIPATRASGMLPIQSYFVPLHMGEARAQTSVLYCQTLHFKSQESNCWIRLSLTPALCTNSPSISMPYFLKSILLTSMDAGNPNPEFLGMSIRADHLPLTYGVKVVDEQSSLLGLED